MWPPFTRILSNVCQRQDMFLAMFLFYCHISLSFFFFLEVFTLTSSFRLSKSNIYSLKKITIHSLFLDTVFQKIRYFGTFNLISFRWLRCNRHPASVKTSVIPGMKKPTLRMNWLNSGLYRARAQKSENCTWNVESKRSFSRTVTAVMMTNERCCVSNLHCAISVSRCLPSESWPHVRLWSGRKETLSPQLISRWLIYLEPRYFLYSTQPQARCDSHAIILSIWPKQHIWGRRPAAQFWTQMLTAAWADTWADGVLTTMTKRKHSLSGTKSHKVIQQVCKDKIGTTTKHSNWRYGWVGHNRLDPYTDWDHVLIFNG